MRKIFIGIVGCTILLLAGYVGYHAWRNWRQNHMLAAARGFAAKSDLQNSLLSLREVLQWNHQNVEATRMIAEIKEVQRAPDALKWRMQVVELNPHSLDDRIALVRSALASRDLFTASNALEAVDEPDRKKAVYQNVAGAVAAANNQFSTAEACFEEASKLEPQNAAPQLNLAIVRLHETNSAHFADARLTLDRLSNNTTNSALRCQALRELIPDLMRQGRAADADRLCDRLLQETNSVFADHLVKLQVLHDSAPAAFQKDLVTIQREASDNPGKIYDVAVWELNHLSPKDTLAWLKSLPQATQTNQPGAMLIVECYSALQDWHDLHDFVASQNWGELEFVRHALASQALRGQELFTASKSEWDEALKATNNQEAALVMLLRLASQWHWDKETQQLLNTVVSLYPGERWAVRALLSMYYLEGNTRALMLLFDQQSKRYPNDLQNLNNLAMCALLLNEQEFKPFDLAERVYQKNRANVHFAATYAFGLELQNKNADALKVFQNFKPAELEDPGIAGYYGAALKAAGNRAEARKYFDISLNPTDPKKKPLLLPEETKYLEKARAGT